MLQGLNTLSLVYKRKIIPLALGCYTISYGKTDLGILNLFLCELMSVAYNLFFLSHVCTTVIYLLFSIDLFLSITL